MTVTTQLRQLPTAQSRGGASVEQKSSCPNEPIDYPLVDKVETLIAMSQPALSKYADDLLPTGLLIVDPDMVNKMPERNDIRIMRIPAAKTADALGRRIFENMVMLGALQVKTKVISAESLLAAIRENVPPKTVDVNLKAAREGMRSSIIIEMRTWCSQPVISALDVVRNTPLAEKAVVCSKCEGLFGDRIRL